MIINTFWELQPSWWPLSWWRDTQIEACDWLKVWLHFLAEVMLLPLHVLKLYQLYHFKEHYKLSSYIHNTLCILIIIISDIITRIASEWLILLERLYNYVNKFHISHCFIIFWSTIWILLCEQFDIIVPTTSTLNTWSKLTTIINYLVHPFLKL